MTNKEASFILANIDRRVCDDELSDALDMAIKALEQQPCEDCISRKDVLAMKRLFVDEDGVMAYAVPTGNILRLRPVIPKYTDEEIDKAQAVEQAYVDKMVELAVEETKRPTGHWIETAQEYYEMINEKGGGVDDNTPYFTDDIACSECLAKFSVIDNETERFDFCPNCGARMVEPQESEV